MRFYVDTRNLKELPWRGQQIYIYNIVREMLKIGREHQFHLHFDRNSWPAHVDHVAEFSHAKRHLHSGKYWSHASIPLNMLRTRSNVYYRMYNEDQRVYTPIPGKTTILILDNGKHIYPEFYGGHNADLVRNLVSKYIYNFSGIGVISETVRDELVSLFNYPAQNIFVAPPAPSLLYYEAETGEKPSLLPKGIPFVLIVNPGGANKNWRQMLAGFSLYKASQQSDADLMLVVAGNLGYESDSIINTINADPLLKWNTLCLGYVSESELRYLYSKASLLLYLSHYEGFGMPIVEALSFKLPVIASDIPVFREVARDAALFAPLGDTDLVAEYIEKIRTDSELLSKLTSRGLKLCDAYNWHDSAATTLSALCRIAES